MVALLLLTFGKGFTLSKTTELFKVSWQSPNVSGTDEFKICAKGQSATGNFQAIATAEGVIFFANSQGKMIWRRTLTDPCVAAFITPTSDGNHLAIVDAEQNLHMWEWRESRWHKMPVDLDRDGKGRTKLSQNACFTKWSHVQSQWVLNIQYEGHKVGSPDEKSIYIARVDDAPKAAAYVQMDIPKSF